jgi:phosphate-selective porin
VHLKARQFKVLRLQRSYNVSSQNGLTTLDGVSGASHNEGITINYMSKVILTKNRRKALDIALSLDDILYETHRRMMERFRKDVERWNRQKQVVQVIKGNQIMQNMIYRKSIYPSSNNPL